MMSDLQEDASDVALLGPVVDLRTLGDCTFFCSSGCTPDWDRGVLKAGAGGLGGGSGGGGGGGSMFTQGFIQ